MTQRFTVTTFDYFFIIRDNQRHRDLPNLRHVRQADAQAIADAMNASPDHPYIPR